MAKKKPLKKHKVTHTRKQTTPSVTDVLSLPPGQTVTDMSYYDLKKAAMLYNQSSIAHWTEHMSILVSLGHPLSNWEIEMIDQLIEDFRAKYKSPLAEALK